MSTQTTAKNRSTKTSKKNARRRAKRAMAASRALASLLLAAGSPKVEPDQKSLGLATGPAAPAQAEEALRSKPGLRQADREPVLAPVVGEEPVPILIVTPPGQKCSSGTGALDPCVSGQPGAAPRAASVRERKVDLSEERDTESKKMLDARPGERLTQTKEKYVVGLSRITIPGVAGLTLGQTAPDEHSELNRVLETVAFGDRCGDEKKLDQAARDQLYAELLAAQIRADEERNAAQEASDRAFAAALNAKLRAEEEDQRVAQSLALTQALAEGERPPVGAPAREHRCPQCLILLNPLPGASGGVLMCGAACSASLGMQIGCGRRYRLRDGHPVLATVR